MTADEHIDKAFSALDDLTVRELEATAEALSSSRHPLTTLPASSATPRRLVKGAGTRIFPASTFGKP